MVDNFFLKREGGERKKRRQRAFEEKESRRWITGAKSASALAEAGAVCVTVIEDREGDVYECFAFKPANVEKLVRAAPDRRLADGTTLFSRWKSSSVMQLVAEREGKAKRPLSDVFDPDEEPVLERVCQS